MKNFKKKFQDDPMFAAIVLAGGAQIAVMLLTATAKFIGSSGYALHAAKRK